MTEAEADVAPEAKSCPRCGTDLSAAVSPGGLCPKCLLEMGLSDGDSAPEVEVAGEESSAEPPPGLEELSPRFPQLELIELLGRGGMGTVYKARQKGLDRLVALKIMPAAAAKDPSWPERFAREARALARLSHPNIVGVYDSGEVDGVYFFAMEFVDGVNLRQMIRAKSASPKDALAVVSQICDALQYAHEEGVVHRDIKPENILVDQRGRVKIADFGLAKLLGGKDGGYTLTRSQQTMGTPHYMAPEQWEKPLDVDHRADIYSLGVVFYELLTGELPLGRFAPPSAKIRVDVKLDEVVLKSLAKEPELRYQQASQVKTDVEGVAEQAERDEQQPRRGRIRRLFAHVKRVLDPRTSGRKRLGNMEYGNNWMPLLIVGFLLLCVLLAVAGVGSLMVFVMALVGIWFVLKNSV
jgi:serine/threonine protein kinase